ncbi:MAG: HAD family hydrolase, partial [Candidatus Bathyarchaeota archaeon]
MSEEYLKFQVGNSAAYVRVCCLDRLREADAAIFDCDGVLIDTRDSYRKSIIETVKYLVRELTDAEPPTDKVLMETTHLLKRSGGFNNDWDVAYAILLFLFSKMPEEFKSEFIALTRSERLLNMGTLRERFDYLRASLKSRPAEFIVGSDELETELKRFTQNVDDSGIDSVESVFINSDGKEIFSAAKRFLNYPGDARESLLTTIFDEMFYGPKLFEETHKRKRQFYHGAGFVEIEREKTLVTSGVLEDLAQSLKKENFGIVSGRDRLSARFSLGKILDKFRREAVIFLMDCNYPSEQVEEERAKLRKPNPYPLIKASKGLAPFKYSLYIGDSAE